MGDQEAGYWVVSSLKYSECVVIMDFSNEYAENEQIDQEQENGEVGLISEKCDFCKFRNFIVKISACKLL